MPFTGPGGSNPVEYVRALGRQLTPTEGDLIYALGKQALRIQERTCGGVDYRGDAFAPYSTRKYYYHDPSKESRYSGYTSIRSRKELALHHQRFYGGTRTKKGTHIRYDSYAAFKAARGVGTVDLGGMEGRLLPSIRVRMSGEYDPETATGIGITDQSGMIHEGFIGIYDGEEAKIAEGHNEGIPGRLPQRTFMGISDEDMQMITADIFERIQERNRNFATGYAEY